MLLRNLIIIVLFLSLISTVLMGSVAWYGQNALIELEDEEKPVTALIQSVTMLRNLQFDYLVSQESRSLEQWRIVYNKAFNLSSEIIVDDPASQARMDRIKRSLITLETIFDSARVGSPKSLVEIDSTQHKKYSLIYQILNQQSLNALDELSQMNREIADKKGIIRQQTGLITLITFTLIPLLIFLSLLFLYFRLDRSLSRLEKGTKIIGAGDLHHRIEMRGNDEFVMLAKSFNQMVEDLHKGLISRDLLKEEKQKAEAANRSKSIFLANISHELRTPLNAILGFSLLLSRDCSLNHTQISKLEIINKSGEHLLTIINDVLDMAKIESGRVSANIQTFDLHRLVQSVFHLFSLQSSEKALGYELEIEEDIPRFIDSDPGKIRQILVNLLGNAIKFTDSGRITIITSTVLRTDQRSSTNKANQTRPELSFQVSDTGKGIPPSDLSTIFEPFEQVERGREGSEGTGLGLSISREYAELLGGSLTVTSSGIPGEGSTFTLLLPYTTPSTEIQSGLPLEKRKKTVQSHPDDLRILIVDDHKENRELLTAYHEILGICARQVSGGKEAIRCSKEWHPHLIWMDIYMPIMNGIEAMKEIRREAGATMPVIIAISASVFEDQQKNYLKEGFDAFLAKPFNEQDIVHTLENHLDIEFSLKTYEECDHQQNASINYFPPDLSHIPPEIIGQICEHASSGNITQILLCIDKIRLYDESLSEHLLAYADIFDFKGMIFFLKDRQDL